MPRLFCKMQKVCKIDQWEPKKHMFQTKKKSLNPKHLKFDEILLQLFKILFKIHTKRKVWLIQQNFVWINQVNAFVNSQQQFWFYTTTTKRTTKSLVVSAFF